MVVAVIRHPAAIGAEVAGPGAVIDFAQRCQGFGFGFGVHGEDAAEILEHDDAEIADLPEQAATPASCYFPLGVWLTPADFCAT